MLWRRTFQVNQPGGRTVTWGYRLYSESGTGRSCASAHSKAMIRSLEMRSFGVGSAFTGSLVSCAVAAGPARSRGVLIGALGLGGQH